MCITHSTAETRLGEGNDRVTVITANFFAGDFCTGNYGLRLICEGETVIYGVKGKAWICKPIT